MKFVLKICLWLSVEVGLVVMMSAPPSPSTPPPDLRIHCIQCYLSKGNPFRCLEETDPAEAEPCAEEYKFCVVKLNEMSQTYNRFCSKDAHECNDFGKNECNACKPAGTGKYNTCVPSLERPVVVMHCIVCRSDENTPETCGLRIDPSQVTACQSSDKYCYVSFQNDMYSMGCSALDLCVGFARDMCSSCQPNNGERICIPVLVNGTENPITVLNESVTPVRELMPTETITKTTFLLPPPMLSLAGRLDLALLTIIFAVFL